MEVSAPCTLARFRLMEEGVGEGAGGGLGLGEGYDGGVLSLSSSAELELAPPGAGLSAEGVPAQTHASKY